MMAAALSSISYFLFLDASYTPVAVVVSVVLFNAAFGLSWGPIPWLLGPEIMPLPFRVKGVSISTATNWLFNWLVRRALLLALCVVLIVIRDHRLASRRRFCKTRFVGDFISFTLDSAFAPSSSVSSSSSVAYFLDG